MKKNTVHIFIMMILLAGCSLRQEGGGYYQDDGPHSRPLVDVSAIPDARPRNDPPSANGNRPYTVFGKTYHPSEFNGNYRERGIASWYGKKFHGKKTSSGEPYDMYAMTAAHKTLLLPTYVRVRNLENGKTVTVRVNDRGPFLHDRLIDLSYAAAARIGILDTGTGLVEVETLDMVDDTGAGPDQAMAGDESAPAPATEAPRLFLQVGAFVNRENAVKIQAGLEQARITPVVVEPVTKNQLRLYRVRVGPLSSVEESDQVAERVMAYGISDAHVVVE